MSSTETRTVNLRIDPALQACFDHLDSTGGAFNIRAYDLFAAGYRSRVGEEAQMIALAEVRAYDAGYRQGREDGYDAGLTDANEDAPLGTERGEP